MKNVTHLTFIIPRHIIAIHRETKCKLLANCLRQMQRKYEYKTCSLVVIFFFFYKFSNPFQHKHAHVFSYAHFIIQISFKNTRSPDSLLIKGIGPSFPRIKIIPLMTNSHRFPHSMQYRILIFTLKKLISFSNKYT